MNLLVLPGDGIGPEIVGVAVDVLRAADTKFGLGLRFDFEDIGFVALRAIELAVDRVLANPAARTADLGGSLGCRAFGARVADAL